MSVKVGVDMNIKMIGSGSIMSVKNSPSYLVDDCILVDVPNGTNKAIKRLKYDITNLKAILITHFHADHFFDLPFILLNLYINTNEERKNKLYIVCNENEKHKIKEIIELSSFKSYDEFVRKLNIEIVGISDGIVLNNILDKYEVEVVEVKHSSPAFGYVIIDKINNQKVGFTGDAILCEAVEHIVKKSDISFCDTSEITGNQDSHMGIDNINFLLKKYNKKIVTTHLREEVRKKIIDLKNKNYMLGEDGEEFNI